MFAEEGEAAASTKLDSYLGNGMSNKAENFLEEGSETPLRDTRSGIRHPYSVRRRKIDEVKQARPEEYRSFLGSPGEKLTANNDFDMNLNRESMGTEFEVKPQSGVGKSQGSECLSDSEIGKVERFLQNYENISSSNSKYPHDGPSNNYTSSSYGFNGEEHLEQDRDEILRKLDELKDQLRRSCNVAEKSKDSASPYAGRMVRQNPYNDKETWSPSRSVNSDGSSMQFVQPDKYNTRPYYNSHYPEPHPYVNRHERSMHHAYSTMHTSHNIPSYGSHIQYQQQQLSHHLSCSCFHCYEKHQQGHRFVDVPQNPTLYNHKNSSDFVPQSYNNRTMNPREAHMGWPRDVNSNMGGGVLHGGTHKVGPVKIRRHCRPISGGAPFITCHSCFELLQLPKEVVLHMERSKQKVKCGSCSVVLSCVLLDKKLIVAVHEVTEQIVIEDSKSSEEVVKPVSNDPINQDGVNFNSDDFDSPDYDFQSMDDPLLSSSKTNEVNSLHSSSSTRSEDENSQDGGLITRRQVNRSVDSPNNPPPSGSPRQEHFNYSSNNQEVDEITKENQINDSNKLISLQSSIGEASAVATEMDVSFTGVSQDSGDTSREEIQPVINRHVRPDHIAEDQNSNVTVNGHRIRDQLVKKAEKLAGPIRPGNYWYDSLAGFWGVIGGPCLGIIPPFIEEFNYPMAEDCAGGNTSVFVNGRELHPNDFELLTSRGLPSSRDKSYIVYISGKVVDEDTGDELRSLGKLAPTVEKAKHGFGMKVPRRVPR